LNALIVLTNNALCLCFVVDESTFGSGGWRSLTMGEGSLNCGSESIGVSLVWSELTTAPFVFYFFSTHHWTHKTISLH
jgi:hypothetical protein